MLLKNAKKATMTKNHLVAFVYKTNGSNQLQSVMNYLTALKWWAVEMYRYGNVAVTGIFHSVKSQFITHISNIVFLTISHLLDRHFSLLTLLFMGPVETNL